MTARRDRSIQSPVEPPQSRVKPPRSRNVIGPDDRRLVEHPQQRPWRHICMLEIGWADGTGRGTGWLAAPRVVVTAGHCVFSARPGVGWARAMRLSFPDGRLMELDAPVLRTTTRWAEQLDIEYDYAVILLPEAVDDGFLSMRALVEGDFSATVTVPGYPRDRRDGPWAAPGRIYPNRERRRLLRHVADTQIGESGAPLLRADGEVHRVVGIHTWGESDAANLAVAFVPAVVQTIGGWAAEWEGA